MRALNLFKSALYLYPLFLASSSTSIRGTTRRSSSSSTTAQKGDSSTTRELLDLPDRKTPPLKSKDALKLQRSSYLDRLNTPRPSNDITSTPSTSTPSESPSSEPTQTPSSSPTWSLTSSQSPTINTTFTTDQLTVGVFYYPWHNVDFHRGDGYVREQLVPKQFPELGEYDDSKPGVISQHLKWSRQANIHLWVTSWWGKDRRTDKTTKLILEHRELKNHRIALHYETFGRIIEGENYTLHRVAPDLKYICQTYFSHENYYTIDDRPVLVVYLTRSLWKRNLLPEVVQIMRQTVQQECGQELYIAGDQIYGRLSGTMTNPYQPFELLDAVLNYDVYGSMGGITGDKGGTKDRQQLRDYYRVDQKLWRDLAKQHNCSYIPTVAPGYNDHGHRPQKQHPPLNRKLTNGEYLFDIALKFARELVDMDVQNLILVNSFNEWHEDTQIEPVAAVGDKTMEPQNLTYGISYEPYGDLYLQMLRDRTT